MKKLQELLQQIAEKDNQINQLFDAADKRGDGVNTKEEMATIKSLNQELESLHTEASDLKEAQELRRGHESRQKNLTDGERIVGSTKSEGASENREQGYMSPGQEVLSAPDMVKWLKEVAGAGFGPSQGVSLQSPRITIKSLVTGTSGAQLNTSTSGGALVLSDRRNIIDSSYARPLSLVDLLTRSETSSDTVEYVRVTSVTNSAAPVPEATGSGDGSGVKPESALALARVIEPVKTIAHWVPATTRALADAPQIRTLIDTFLRYGIEEELEDQIINGDGTGENFTGVLNVSGTTPQAYDTDLLVTTRKARTKVRTVGRQIPTAFVFNPVDWETIDLLTDNEKRYYFGGPTVLGTPRLWGLPVIECEGMPEGTAVVADWRNCILWERMQTLISMSNSHSDFFIRNLVAILAEYRAAFGIQRPKAIVEIDLTA